MKKWSPRVGFNTGYDVERRFRIANILIKVCFTIVCIILYESYSTHLLIRHSLAVRNLRHALNLN